MNKLNFQLYVKINNSNREYLIVLVRNFGIKYSLHNSVGNFCIENKCTSINRINLKISKSVLHILF